MNNFCPLTGGPWSSHPTWCEGQPRRCPLRSGRSKVHEQFETTCSRAPSWSIGVGIEPNSSRPLLKPHVSRADDTTRTFASFKLFQIGQWLRTMDPLFPPRSCTSVASANRALSGCPFRSQSRFKANRWRLWVMASGLSIPGRLTMSSSLFCSHADKSQE